MDKIFKPCNTHHVEPPAPSNLIVSAGVFPKVMLRVWFLSSIGANALQVTLTWNFGGEGVVPEGVWIFRPSMVVSLTRAKREFVWSIQKIGASQWTLSITPTNEINPHIYIYYCNGRHPTPVDRWFIPLSIGFQPSKVVQDFFHP